MKKYGVWLNTKEFNAAFELKRASTDLNIPIEHFDTIIKTHDGLINRGMFRISERGIEWHYLNDDGDWVACNPPLAFMVTLKLIVSKRLDEIEKTGCTTIQ